ncbi:MAG TPA: SPFH domain-containing protein [Anaerolineae bacterium]|nr:SPFH domain-containing protein [Anaerolineae bacterium]
MANEQYLESIELPQAQLTQLHVPLNEAMTAFTTRDASGIIPIVVVPERQLGVRVELLGQRVIVLVGGIYVGNLLNNSLLLILAVLAGLLITLLGLYRALHVRIPEGVNALVARGGRYTGTLTPGPHLILPWTAITHLVTRREIPFSVPVTDAPTQDNVRATVGTLITFSITDPYRFVFNISADDFDQVFQATCQDSLRAMVRQINSDQVNDLVRQDLAELRQTLSTDVEPYGVTIMKINIIQAHPPADFVASQEACQLAILQQAEQAKKQALTLRRQMDQEILARQQVIARVEREREELQLEIQRAEARRRVFALEAEAEELRLAKLEERLQRFPQAVKWEWQDNQLNVARSLAGNTRAVVQLGNTDALVRSILLRDFSGLQAATLEEGDDGNADGIT